ncbi:hypothetical protein KAM621c_47810 [Citrobacter braakii]|uniref:Uncharacterized protein n=1 Tax=Citrobacter braakii TaxID=57706 RepID=A0AAD1L968_CITBR|nr:hypothetical protein KAM621c_47810 [Citrobacter braakii]
MLACTNALKRDEQGNRRYLFWQNDAGGRRLLWCPHFFAVSALDALAALRIMPIADDFSLVATWAKLTTISGEIR